MRALIIGPSETALIKAAIERARANPVPLEEVKRIGRDTNAEVLHLKDHSDRVTHAISVHLPFGYTAAISFEQQPAGLVRHISISVDTPGKMPHMAAVKMIWEAFGMKMPDRSWMEEFAPGHYAVNLVELERGDDAEDMEHTRS